MLTDWDKRVTRKLDKLAFQSLSLAGVDWKAVLNNDPKLLDEYLNYLKVKNFDDRKIESARDKDIIEIVLEAKDSYGNITQKTISITFTDTQVKERTKAFGKIRFISEKYYGKNKAGGLMENSRWLNDPEFNSLLRQALAI